MNEEKNTLENPNFEPEEMKMPENTASETMGAMGNETVSMATEEKKVVSGPIIAILAVSLLLILGGLYYWFTVMSVEEPAMTPPPTERPTAEVNNEPESTTAEAQTDAMLVTSPSDEIGAIEADLEATDLDNMDAELEAIDAEIEAALREEI